MVYFLFPQPARLRRLVRSYPHASDSKCEKSPRERLIADGTSGPREGGHGVQRTVFKFGGVGVKQGMNITTTKSSASEVKIQHRSLLIERGYEEFTGRLEQILGRLVESKLKGLTRDGAMEALKSMEGEQGFMIIKILDHGADLLMLGQRRKAKQYLIGNPLVAIQMTRYDIRAALYAPLRVLVFEPEPGLTVVEFDQPSTLFGQFGRNEVTAVAVESDGKLDRVIAKAAMT